MGTEKVVSDISDVEWVSVSAYLQWLEAQAGLTPFSVSGIYSFRVGKGGFPALAAKKEKLATILRNNMRKLEVWVAANKPEVEATEMVFIRSMWITTRDTLTIVTDQKVRADILANSETFADEYETEGESYETDSFPF